MLEEDLPPDEAFLRDYMLNAMWKRPVEADGGGGGDGVGSDGEGGGEEEGEEAGGTFSDREDDF